MFHKLLMLGAAISLSVGLAACASDEMKGSLPPAKPAAAGEEPAGEDMAAEEAAGEDMAAEEAAGGEMVTEDAATEEMTAEEVSPEGVETEETVTETVMTEEEVPPPEKTVEERLTEREMLRDVRNGSYAIRYCQDIDDVTIKVFDDCVTGQITTAETDGKLTESYQLGADYQAWVFLGQHAETIHEKGYEWTKEYRQIFRSRAGYQKSVQNLIQRTGLDEREVCAQLKGDC